MLQELVPYPQIIFEKSGPQVRRDVEEMQTLGRDKYTEVLLGAIFLPGPNKEEWETLDIIAPIGSKQWQLKRSDVWQPLRVQIESTDARKLIPSLKWQHIQSWMQTSVEPPPNR